MNLTPEQICREYFLGMSTTKPQRKSSLSIFFSYLLYPINWFGRLGKRGKIIVLILLGLLIFQRINAYKKSGIEVEIINPKTGKVVQSISAAGEVAAIKAANLLFQTTGEVKEVNFHQGDPVKKGDIIAKLDTVSLYSTYQQTSANLRAAEASLNYTLDTLKGKERTENYSEIASRTAAETAKDKAYWAYTAAAQSLSGAYIKAPFDGVLTKVPENIYPGSSISLTSGGIFQVVDPNTIYFNSEVSELDVNKLKIDSQVEIDIDSFPEKTFRGKVKNYNFTSVRTSTGGTAYEVRIDFDSTDALPLMIGMNGDANIILSEKENVLIVPITSVTEIDNKSYVWKVENGKAKRVEITTGISSVNDVEVISGISEEDKIIKRPPTQIADNLKIKLKK